MNKRPINTLFMIESLDGKINSGDSDELDVDRDWCEIDGVKEGLHQYYEIEKTTDWYSLNTGKVMAKIGVNVKTEKPNKIECRFIIIDNYPHLTENGIDYLCNWVEKLYLITTNREHPAFKVKNLYSNLEIIYYDKLDFNRMFEDMYEKYNVRKITIQSGGTLNSEFLRNGLLDYVHIVIAPILVGGSTTNTLIDGKSISNVSELNKLKALKLEECKVLENSYIELKYNVLN